MWSLWVLTYLKRTRRPFVLDYGMIRSGLDVSGHRADLGTRTWSNNWELSLKTSQSSRLFWDSFLEFCAEKETKNGCNPVPVTSDHHWSFLTWKVLKHAWWLPVSWTVMKIIAIPWGSSIPSNELCCSWLQDDRSQACLSLQSTIQ